MATLLVALALIASACGSSATDQAEAEAAPVAEPAAAETTDGEPDEADAEEASEPEDSDPETAAESETESEAQPDDESDDPALAADEEAADPVVVELGEADWTGMTEWTLGALGGITFGVPEGHSVHYDADMVTIRNAYDDNRGRYEPSMVVTLTVQNGSGDPISTIEAFTTNAITGIGTAAPTNETLTLFGQEMQGWRFTVNEGQPVGPHYLYSAYPPGIGGPSAWQPFPVAELFLAEVPGGVLVVGATARSDEDLVTARGIFDRVAPTLSLAQSIETELPPVARLSGQPEPPPEPTEVPDGWPSLLTSMSTILDAGDYSVNAVETAMSVTVDDGWWVQLNFPSWFILSADESFGPGDRNITFRTGLEAWYPASRYGPLGDAIPFDIAALMAAPPPNIEIIESEEVTVGGAAGTRVRLAIAEDAGCGADDLCEYMLTTVYRISPESIRKGYVYDMWYLEDGLTTPVLIIVMTPDDAWFDVANELIATIEFDTTG